jgi:hypothetical protein
MNLKWTENCKTIPNLMSNKTLIMDVREVGSLAAQQPSSLKLAAYQPGSLAAWQPSSLAAK